MGYRRVPLPPARMIPLCCAIDMKKPGALLRGFRRRVALRLPPDFEEVLIGEGVRAQAREKIICLLDGGPREFAEHAGNDVLPRYGRRTMRANAEPRLGEKPLRGRLGE